MVEAFTGALKKGYDAIRVIRKSILDFYHSGASTTVSRANLLQWCFDLELCQLEQAPSADAGKTFFRGAMMYLAYPASISGLFADRLDALKARLTAGDGLPLRTS